jgi:GNAT superfamily N-acetyltransferase
LDAGRFYSGSDPLSFQVPEEDGLAEWHDQLLAQPTDSDLLRLVAEVDGEVAGSLTARIEAPVANPSRQMVRYVTETRCIVHVLLVRDTAKRRGIGTALMQAAEEWAIGQGAKRMILDTYLESPESMPFYEHRMGYSRHAMLFQKALR